VTKSGHEVIFSALSSWIQEVDLSGCRIKSGMAEKFGLSKKELTNERKGKRKV
jgi:hypothetical protein